MLPTGTPTFSVVIPLYNRAAIIEQTLRSVLDQTFQDFEIVVIDDGSEDNPQPVISGLGDSRIRYVRQNNSGANVARNRGIDEAVGRYIAFLDSDDRFLPHHLESSLKCLSRAENIVSFARIIVDRGSGNAFTKPPRGPGVNEPMSEYLCCDKGFVQTSTLALPRKLAQETRYLEWLPYGQDVDFACRLAQKGAQFVFIEQPGAIWNDIKDAKRISSKSSPDVRLRWSTENGALLTAKARRGYIGWRVAKAYAENGQLLKGLQLFFGAAVRGAYSPKHALTVFLQILLAGGSYRRLSDVLIKARGRARPAT